MFGLLKSRPPLSTAQRVDIELLLRRNVEVVGASWVRQTQVVTDIAEWNLDSLSGQQRLDAAAAQVVQRMPTGLQPCRLEIQSVETLQFPSAYLAAQNDGQAVITLSDETLGDPLRTVMELTYQYGCHFWHRMTDGRSLDLQPRTTHLTAICWGLGVLASDACLYDKNWSQAGWSGWSISRAGYYNAEEIGYALALFCRTRHETRPAWLSALRLDSKVTFDKAQRYFSSHQRNGHRLLYDAETIPSTRCEPRELAAWLTGKDGSLAYASALALVQREQLPSSVGEAAATAIDRGDPELSWLAIRILGRLRSPNREVEACLRRLITRGSPVIQAAAIESAAELGMPLDSYQPQLSRLLRRAPVDPMPLLEIIRGQGKVFASMSPLICQLLERSLHEQDPEWTRQLAVCLQSITDDPAATIQQHIRRNQREALEKLEKREVKGEG